MLKNVFFVLLISISHAQRFVSGPCPSINPPEGFDKHRVGRKGVHLLIVTIKYSLFSCKFFGEWTETEKTPSIFDLAMRCMKVEYSDDKDGSINVNVKGISL